MIYKSFRGLTVAVTLFLLPFNLAAQTNVKQTKTLTNRELETYKQKREASEAADDQRRRAQGLPSRVEEQKRRAQDDERLTAFANRQAAQRNLNREFFQTQAAALKREAASVTAQIAYWQTQLDNVSRNNRISVLPVSGFINLAPNIYQPNVVRRPDLQNPSPQNPVYGSSVAINNSSSASGLALSGSLRVNRGGTRASIGFGAYRGNRRESSRYYDSSNYYGSSNYYPNVYPSLSYPGTILVAPNGFNNFADNGDAYVIRERLRELYALRAAINARWDLLQSDATRAGIEAGDLR